MAANSDAGADILHDFFPFLRHYKDGRIQRLMGIDTVPPSLDPTTGVQSKDVQISPEVPVSARLYLPHIHDPTRKLPLILYFHGGGFVIESAFSVQYHKHVNILAAEAGAIVVSVEYRLAPESPIPAAFDDAWTALKWVASESNDEWIKQYANLDRVYLAGDSAGATIAHNVAVRLGSERVDGIRLAGLILNCPFFSGKEPRKTDAEDEVARRRGTAGKLLLYVCPNLTGLDEAWINPGMDPKLSNLACGRVLVYVGEKDGLSGQGWAYKAALESCRWEGDVEVVEVEGEGHVFSVQSPDGKAGQAMLKKVAAFVNGGDGVYSTPRI